MRRISGGYGGRPQATRGAGYGAMRGVMRTAMRGATVAVAAAALSVFAGCAPAVNVGISTASELKPHAYHTYTWVIADEFPTGDPRLDSNPFFVATLKATVDTEFGRMGLAEGDGAADLTVHFHATVQRAFDVYDVDRRAGYDQPGYERVPQVRQYDEGTVLVDVSDRATRRVIWRGWMQTDLSGAIGNDKVMSDRLGRGIRKLFERFPAQCVGEGR